VQEHSLPLRASLASPRRWKVVCRVATRNGSLWRNGHLQETTGVPSALLCFIWSACPFGHLLVWPQKILTFLCRCGYDSGPYLSPALFMDRSWIDNYQFISKRLTIQETGVR